MNIRLNKNPLVQYLGKPAKEFTLADILDYIEKNDIEMVNFMYPAADGRLKTLNFVVNDFDYITAVLSQGERVDGSSLFPYIDPSNSDLYVLPRFSTAFLDPFSEIPAIGMLCSYFDKDGQPLEMSPEYTLRKACREFKRSTGCDFHAMGELEYYVTGSCDTSFPATDQHGYHESSPFVKFNDFRVQCMKYIAQAGGRIKYGHSEVGNFTEGNTVYEQNEIEFLPVDAPDAADQLMIAKWVIRTLAHRNGLTVTFAPKITAGKAGSGLHIHMKLVRDGMNIMLDSDKRLSEPARRAIAGMMTLAPSITAFGNRIPTSYFRLVPHQEAPTSICWGDRNRSVLVRVPLGWTADADMCASVNPGSKSLAGDAWQKQTVEIRSADCSADVYLLMAALAVACRYGMEMENALEVAKKTYVDVDIHKSDDRNIADSLESLPECCADAADALERQRAVYEHHGVFSPALIDGIINQLRGYNDRLTVLEARTDQSLMKRIVEEFYYCG